MRTLLLATALVALTGLAVASPTPTDKESLSKRALVPVTVSGNAFWQGSTRFYIRGIDYQPGGSSLGLDPLADPKVCMRDIAKFKQLGINTIRVYMVDNSKTHDVCMGALADAGIYVVVDANNPGYSLHRFLPGPSYNAQYLQSVFATVDDFAKYTNTLAFFSGNEVINDNVSSTVSAKYVKAVTRDMRQYLAVRKLRKIPVGYSAADVAVNRMEQALYFNCGSDDERSDFFAFNDYSWCNTDLKTSQWDQKVKNFTNYGLPIFLSEYGCTANGRDFGEVQALMSRDMTGVYSGGLMYEYTNEENNFGIVQLENPATSTDVKELEGFAKFAHALATYPAPTGDGGASASTHSVACPPKGPHWDVEDTQLPPIPEGADRFFKDGAGIGPGLQGPGSQNAGNQPPIQAPPSSGNQVTDTPAATTSKNAAGETFGGLIEKGPFLMAAWVGVVTIAGTLLL
ncbi:glycoside hydrolase family 72 protein [Schizothecium vesticola]|uniref:1,3-beta-glucanosyltransferase n=1 Tax=Schizothecium vesticola TaxID=314040 RepID=A0AA40F7N2_9PEZI|nr:glycoside hydrolase family 72 protein [Schizothecium vesticola]